MYEKQRLQREFHDMLWKDMLKVCGVCNEKGLQLGLELGMGGAADFNGLTQRSKQTCLNEVFTVSSSFEGDPNPGAEYAYVYCYYCITSVQWITLA